MRGEKGKHPLEGSYTIIDAVGDGARYETVGDRITLESTAADPERQIFCPVHNGSLRYRHLTWGDETVEGSLVELPEHVDRGRFRIELLRPDGLRKIRCAFGAGIGPTEPGSWTAEETGTGGGPDGRGQGGQGKR